ncbi:MAG: type 1 glutamine amidotransferase [Sneathiella sp.]|nr:type 1 glutamine amidotransferase [Sneathiella sp.]
MTLEKSKKIGILQTGRVSGNLKLEFGEYPEMFMNLLGDDRFTYEVYAVVDGVFPNGPEDCDGWIITGSVHGVYEAHDWIKPLEEFIRRLVASNIPTMGICFGHQIMAQAMGGLVEKHPSGWGIGVQEYSDLETGEKAKLLAFHQDQIIEPPKNTTTTHTSDFCQYAGLRYSNTCFSLQPHPEHTIAFSRKLLTERRGSVIPETVTDTAFDTLNNDNSHIAYADRLRNFFLQNRN